jgi:hypothetical protein
MPEFPFIVIDVSIAAPGVIAYSARPDYLGGLGVGVLVAALTAAFITFGASIISFLGRIPKPEYAPAF